MDYTKLYDQIIKRAKDRSQLFNPGYVEKHHILPRSLGGDDSPDNLVSLTFREHFIAHQVLVKKYLQLNDIPRAKKMIYAFNRMLKPGMKGSRSYALARTLFSKFHPMKSETVKKKMILGMQDFYKRTNKFEIVCACGCGKSSGIFSSNPSVNRFIPGHENYGTCGCGCGGSLENRKQKFCEGLLEFTCGCGCGRTGSVSHFHKRDINFIKGHKSAEGKARWKNTTSAKLKKYIDELSDDEKQERIKNSFGTADEAKRRQGIRLGKSSIVKMVNVNGESHTFSSLDAEPVTGLKFEKIKYLIKRYNGLDKETGIQYEYVKKYDGGNKWKK